MHCNFLKLKVNLHIKSKVWLVFIMSVRWLLLFLGLFITGVTHANIDHQRKLFKQASSALSQNKMNQFANLLVQLDDYPIKPYLEYDHFVKRIQSVNIAERSRIHYN